MTQASGLRLQVSGKKQIRPLAGRQHIPTHSARKIRALALIVLGAVGACRASEADTGSGLAPPEDWRALPSLAKAASDAAKDIAVVVDGIEAWGETSRGCYAAWIAMRGTGGAPDVVAQQLVTGLSAEIALMPVVIRDIVKPVAGAQSGVLSLSFERGRYEGKLRASLGTGGRIAALACFWNEREPLACSQACTKLIGSMR